jgi:MFS family permease
MATNFLVDLAPFRRSRDFRLLFAAQLVGLFGRQVAVVAVAFQVFALTHSSLQVGAVSAVQLVPLIGGALVGGVLGDRVERRNLLMAASLSLGCATLVLAVNAGLARPSITVIYVVVAVTALLGGVTSTIGTAAVATRVAPELLVPAYASMQLVDQSAMIVAPALTGLFIAAVELRWVYATAALAYALMAALVRRMSTIGRASRDSTPGLRAVIDGLRYVRRRRTLQGAYLVDLNAMVFGLPRALFPALAVSAFHGGARTLGYLYAAPAAGALAGTLTSGWLGRVRRQGLFVLGAVLVWGVAIAIFGVVHALPIALVLLGIAGWADVVSAVLRTTIVQSSVDERFRGRVSSLHVAVVEGGPRLGDVEAGGVARLASTQLSIITGGLACVAGAVVIGALLPEFRNHRATRT